MHTSVTDLEVCRHEGVVYDHHDVFVVFMGHVRADLDVNHLHGGVGGRLDPHQLHTEEEEEATSLGRGSKNMANTHTLHCCKSCLTVKAKC